MAAVTALGENGFQGRGRSPPRVSPKDAAAVPGSLPRPCGLSDAIFEDSNGRCEGSKSPLYMSITSSFVPPSAEDLANYASARSPRRAPAAWTPIQLAQAPFPALESLDDRERPFSSGEGEFLGLPAVVSPRSSLGARTRAHSPTLVPRMERRFSEAFSELSELRRGSSEPRLGELADVAGCQPRAHNPCAAAAAAAVAAKSVVSAVERTDYDGKWQFAEPSFFSWLCDELNSRPDEEQLPYVPRNHLLEVAKVPRRLEKLLLLGFLLCLDILLHELSFTPLQAVRSCAQMLLGLRQWGSWDHRGGIQDRPPAALLSSRSNGVMLNITEQGDCIRLSLLILNVGLMLLLFDVAWIYHYIEGESFLKLYVLFNMLEMFERWCRSVGVDLFDLLLASIRHPWYKLLPKYAATLVYCFVHATMHLIRVILLNVAINTSSNAVYLIIVTNNFAEIKSTVFKRYEEKSLFPIIASDIVERFYVLLDIIFVIARLSVSEPSGKFTAVDISFWLFLLVVLEIGTDWIKFCLIAKFSEMQAKTFEVYWEVLLADILLCRCGKLGNSQVVGHGEDVLLKDGRERHRLGRDRPAPPYRGIHSFSHSLQRRLGFSGVPMTTILVLHLVMLANAPCTAAAQYPRLAVIVFVVAFFLVCILSKILLGIFLVGFAARRRSCIPRGLELFPKIKSL